MLIQLKIYKPDCKFVIITIILYWKINVINTIKYKCVLQTLYNLLKYIFM